MKLFSKNSNLCDQDIGRSRTDGQTEGQTDDLPWKYRALCIVAKRCVLEQKLQLTAYRKSYMRNRLLSKWTTLTFV